MTGGGTWYSVQVDPGTGKVLGAHADRDDDGDDAAETAQIRAALKGSSVTAAEAAEAAAAKGTVTAVDLDEESTDQAWEVDTTAADGTGSDWRVDLELRQGSPPDQDDGTTWTTRDARRRLTADPAAPHPHPHRRQGRPRTGRAPARRGSRPTLNRDARPASAPPARAPRPAPVPRALPGGAPGRTGGAPRHGPTAVAASRRRAAREGEAEGRGEVGHQEARAGRCRPRRRR